MSLLQRAKWRLISGSIAISLFLISLYFWQTLPLLAVVTCAFIGMSLNEFYSLVKKLGYEPVDSSALVGSVGYVFLLFISFFIPDCSLVSWAFLGSIPLFSFLYFFAAGSNPLVNIALTLFGVCYITIPLSFSLNIAYTFGQEGPYWLLYLVLITKMTDIGALVFGKLFGKNLLARYISPNKTWEGAIGGFCTSMLTSLLFFLWAPVPFTLTESIVWGGFLSLFAQIGDLAESLLKRDIGIKDSSRLPGLGGFLDIADSLVFTTPLLYLLLLLR